MTTPIEEKAKNVSAVEVEEGKQPSEAPVVDLGDASGGDTNSPDKQESKAARNARMYTVQRSHAYEADAQHPTTAGISEADWKAMVIEQIESEYKKNGDIEWLAYVFHDKDTRADGDPVAIHVHIVVRYKKPVAHNVPYDGFKASLAKNCQKVNSPVRVCRYLTHISSDAIEKEKHVYSQKDVVVRSRDGKLAYKQLIKESFWGKTSKKDTLESLKKETDANGYPLMVVEKMPEALMIRSRFAAKVSSGEMRRLEAVKAFKMAAGTHWASTWRVTFKHEHNEFMETRADEILEFGRDLKALYIFGPGGSGKTTIGRGYGNYKAKHRILAASPKGKGKTFDPLGKYDGQDVLVLDEVSGEAFGVDEFLGLVDPNHASTSSSRNEDVFFIGDHVIMTNSKSPKKFMNDMLIYSPGGSELQDKTHPTRVDMQNPDAVEKDWQGRRRINSMIACQPNPDTGVTKVHVFNFRQGTCAKLPNETRGTHAYAGTLEFTVASNGKPLLDEDFYAKLDELTNVDVQSTEPTYVIDDYISQYVVEVEERSSIELFVDEVVSQCMWTLLPTNFLFDLYNAYMKRFYEFEKRLELKSFTDAMTRLLPDWDGPKQVTTGKRMELDEPLISEYDLRSWMRPGRSVKMYGPEIRSFIRKPRYRGFVKK